jgi:hypothetical protein
MLGSNRGVIIALAGIACLGISFGLGAGYSSYQPQEERYPAYRTAPDKIDELDRTTSPTNSKALEYREPCREPKGNDESDLCAQWRAAKAAESAAFWAKWGVIIGAIGTFGLFWTLFYTRKAVLAAENATRDADKALAIAERNAEAAADQVKVARDIGQAETRAYLSVRHIQLQHDRAKECLVLTWQIANAGRSPALHCDIVASMTIFGSHEKVFHELISYDASDIIIGESRIGPVHCPKIKMNEWYFSNDLAFTMELALYYKDVFKGDHTYFTFQRCEKGRGCQQISVPAEFSARRIAELDAHRLSKQGDGS